MPPALHHPAILQHHDAIGVSYCGQAVCHHKRRAPAPAAGAPPGSAPHSRRLRCSLARPGGESARSFKSGSRWPGAGVRHPTGAAALTYHGIVTLWQARDEVSAAARVAASSVTIAVRTGESQVLGHRGRDRCPGSRVQTGTAAVPGTCPGIHPTDEQAPCWGSKERKSRLRTVVLPAPDDPTRATVSPAATSRLNSRSAGRWPPS